MSEKVKTKRSQAERSEATQAKIVQAAMSCLQKFGYSGTSVSKILEQAQVSRGAYLHHFPNKADLLRTAAEQMMRDAYAKLGKATMTTVDRDDRLDAMLKASWEQVFHDPINDVFLELCVGSRSDEELGKAFRPLAASYVKTLQQAARHYYTGKDEADPGDLIILTQWLFRGMAMDIPIASGPEYFDRFVDLWSSVLSGLIESNRAVTGPPPTPRLAKSLGEDRE